MLKERQKVLVMDQDHTFLKIADQKLTDRRFKVFTASNQKNVINVLKSVQVDSILVTKKEDHETVMNVLAALKQNPVILTVGHEYFEASSMITKP